MNMRYRKSDMAIVYLGTLKTNDMQYEQIKEELNTL